MTAYGRLITGLLVTVAALATASPALAGNATFGPPVSGSPFLPATSGLDAYEAAVADFDQNANGNDDLLLPTYGAGLGADSVNVILSPLSSSTAVPAAVGDGPDEVAIGDFNEDGFDDAVVGNNESLNLTILLGSSTGPGNVALAATAQSPISSACGSPNNLTVADVDGDLHQDVVYWANCNAIAILKGAGDGTFTALPSIPVPGISGAGGDAVAVGDFTEDGKEDFLITYRAAVTQDGQLQVYAGNGSGGATLLNTVAVTQGPDPSLSEPVIGDFNDDGSLDVFLTGKDAPVQEAHVMLGGGNGSFSETPDSPFPVGRAGHAAVGDFDSDGHEDIVVATNDDDTFTVLRGRGNGRFDKQVVPVAFPTESVTVGHFSGVEAGNQDLVFTGAGNGGTTVVPGLGPGLNLPPGTFNGWAGYGAARTRAQDVSSNGWSETGPFTTVEYGVPGFPSRATGDRWEGRTGLFAGGPTSASTSATQGTTNFDQAERGSIDVGLGKATLTADLGGYRTDADHMVATARFRDANGAVVSSLTLPPVTPADRNNITQLIRRSATAPIPAGARTYEVELHAAWIQGPYNDALADNVILAFDTPAPPPAPPASDGQAPITLKGKGPKKKIRKQKQATFRFLADEAGATFECRLDKKPPRPCASPARPPKLKPGKHIFRVVAIDDAGNRDSSPVKWSFRLLKP